MCGCENEKQKYSHICTLKIRTLKGGYKKRHIMESLSNIFNHVSIWFYSIR